MVTTLDGAGVGFLRAGAMSEQSVWVLSAQLCFVLTTAWWLRPGLGAQLCHLTAVLHWPVLLGLSSLIHKAVMIPFSIWLIMLI